MHKAYQHLFLHGLLSQAFALNYDVVIFSPFMGYDLDTDYQHAENRVFELANFEQFDAVVYAPCSFTNNAIRKLVEAHLEERCRIPVIALESDDPRWHSILMDDFHAFECVVDHLIEIHGLRRIYCLTGFQGYLQAEERQRGYRHAMEKHGLPVPDGYVIYGDFWKQAALNLAERLASHEIELPEAVVCCCETVAVTLCNRLIELGFRIPEDIVVVGYDEGGEAADNVPSVTTYVRPIVNLGVRAVLRIHELVAGEQSEPVIIDKGYLVPAESCGCSENFQQKFEERQREIHDIENFRQIFEGTPMAEMLNSAQSLMELLHKITEYFYLINGINDWYLCLCDQWDDLSKNSSDVKDYCDYTEIMHQRVIYVDQIADVVDQPFALSEILPALHEDRAEPRAYYITPLHFNARCFGYTALGYGNRTMAYDSLYHAWTRNLNNALEFVRIRNYFNSMNQRLFASSIRDTLTGIYNRHGYTHFADALFAKAAEHAPEKKLLIIAADLDCLKVINDTYGHIEGDNAIAIVANALNTCSAYGEICARMGGDEFLVIGCAEYTDTVIARYISCIHEFLDRYNAESGKPYKVGASIGYVCTAVHKGDSLQTLTDEADARMYANKIFRKKQRQ